MKIFEQVSYDPAADACYLQLTKEPVSDTEIKKNWLMLDKDKNWNLVGIEILAVKKHRKLVDRLLLSQESLEKCVLS